jgi:hypothetical protein
MQGSTCKEQTFGHILTGSAMISSLLALQLVLFHKQGISLLVCSSPSNEKRI